MLFGNEAESEECRLTSGLEEDESEPKERRLPSGFDKSPTTILRASPARCSVIDCLGAL